MSAIMPEQDRDDAGPRRPRPVPESVGQRILARASAESEGVFGSTLGRVARHFAAAEADPADKTELWGRRIGRALSLFGMIVLAYLFVRQLAQR